MSDLMRYARELAENIGPRPVNSEEEQQSAQTIARWLAEGGLEPQIEEFECSTWANWPVMAAFFAMVVAAFASYPHGAMGVVMFIVALLALALFVYERYLHGYLADRRKTGLSQNVVVKYIPQKAAQLERRRKIIIVSHYDTERTALEHNRSFVDGYPILQKANLICMLAIPIIMIVEFLPFVAPIVHWFWLLSCFAALLPLVSGISILLRKFVMPYTDGANNNASGVAAMMGVYENVVGGATQANVPERVIHNAQAARDAGVVNSNVEVVYDVSQGGEEHRSSQRNRNRKERDHNVSPMAFIANLRNRRGKEELESAPMPQEAAEDAEDEFFAMPMEHERPGRDSAYGTGAFEEYSPEREFSERPRRSQGQDLFSELAKRYEDAERQEAQGEGAAAARDGETSVEAAQSPDTLQRHDEKEMSPYQMTLGETQPYTPADVVEAIQEPGIFQAEDDDIVSSAVLPAELFDEAREENVKEGASKEGATEDTPEEDAPKQTSKDADATVEAPAVDVDDSAAESAFEGHEAAEDELAAEQLETAASYLGATGANIGTTMPPLRNGGTGAAAPRQYEPIPAPARTFATPEISDSTPDWWQKAESRRDSARNEKEEEEIKAARSRYAAVPTAEKRRAEREALEASRRQAEEAKAAEEAAKLAKEQQQAAEAEARARAKAAEEAKAAAESAADANKDAADTDVKKDDAASAAEQRVSATTGTFADLAPEERPLWMRDQDKAAEPKASLAGESALADLPDLNKQTPERKAPSLIMDADFGAAQPAPLAEGYTDTPQRGFTDQFNAISSLPTTTTDLGATVKAEAVEAEDATLAEGSGIFEGGTFAPGHTGAFVPVGGTGTFEAVAIDDADIIDDADDSEAVQSPMVGDFSAPANIDIPESRTRRLMGRFKKDKKKREDVSAAEWLGVDEDFNARKAGKDIGSWDNFEEDDNWNGGAVGYDDELDAEHDVVQMAREDALDKEVWFVALGGHGSGNAGMRNFIDRHAKELRGSVIINLDCVGAGEICCLEQEGAYRQSQSDHRMQSLIGKIVPELSGNVEIETLPWADTDATVALRAGLRAITIMGFDKVAPVAFNTKEDTIEILEDSRLELTSELVTELVYRA